VTVKETDLFIHARKNLQDITKEQVLKYRGYIEAYIDRYPDFLQTLKPWRTGGPMPAGHVGADLLSYTDEVVVENGGDIFFKINDPVTVGIFAGESPLSLRTGLHLDTGGKPISVCTSSGSIGHSLSLGKADAVCVVSTSCSLADAAATSIGNRVKSAAHIQTAIDFGKNIDGIRGIVVIISNEIGFWGDLKVVPIKREKG
jgi:ApbE superfamily uncharacterized protein (UPF0280 family)